MFILILSLILFTAQHQQPHVYSVAPNPIMVQEEDSSDCILEPTGGFWYIESDDDIGFSSISCYEAEQAAYRLSPPVTYPSTYYPLKHKKI